MHAYVHHTFSYQEMLSKEEKLKYGEMLRQQMKEKEEKKRQEELEKRGPKRHVEPRPIPQKQNSSFSNQKQALQNRFQNVDYGPFGRAGGGAPNRFYGQSNQPPSNQHLGQPEYPNQQIVHDNPNVRVRTHENDLPIHSQQPSNFRTIDSYQPNYQLQQNQPSQEYYQNPNEHRRQPTEEYIPYRPQPYPPQSNDYRPQNQQQFQNVPPNEPLIPTYGNAYQVPVRQQTYNYDIKQPIQQYPSRQEDRIAEQYQPNEVYQRSREQVNENYERQKTVENNQVTEIHKKGGRNLLQLENVTAEQQIIKQKQKLEMQKQLKLQMEEAERRKREEKEKRDREEREEELRNQQYLERERQKILDEERKKNEKQKELIEQNVRNLEERKRLEEEAKLKANQAKNRSIAIKTPEKFQPQQKQTFTKQAQLQYVSDQTESQGSSSIIMEQAFNTDVSKQFFQQERKRDQEKYHREKNLEAVTDEIKKMRDQIDRQNELFKKEIDKVKYESEMAEVEKRKAENEIDILKAQLKQKMEDDNERLYLALQRQQHLKNESEYEADNKKKRRKQPQREDYYENQSEFDIPRASKNDQLVKKKYIVQKQTDDVPKYNPNLEESYAGEDGLYSLHGQSKKIPLNIDDPKLSMSKLSDYARETNYFKHPPTNKKKASQHHIQQSIVEEEEERIESRAANRKKFDLKSPEDELDKMMKSRQKSRGGWGQMSSVNSDITKEIEELLRKKETQKNDRPTSHLSNAGRQTLSRHGVQYEGQSINSYSNGNGTLNTLEMDRLQNRNEARLNELRNLGVETINTNNDEEFSKLDEILNKYKQDRSRAL